MAHPFVRQSLGKWEVEPPTEVPTGTGVVQGLRWGQLFIVLPRPVLSPRVTSTTIVEAFGCSVKVRTVLSENIPGSSSFCLPGGGACPSKGQVEDEIWKDRVRMGNIGKQIGEPEFERTVPGA